MKYLSDWILEFLTIWIYNDLYVICTYMYVYIV